MRRFVVLSPFLPLLAASARASDSVPTDIQQPGTQPLEVGAFVSPNNCDNCHGNITQPVNPGLEREREPAFGWRGGMMANAGRDGLFWATLAVAEQDFLPDADPALRGGAGDLCIRCHSVGGWMAGRSTPTNGSGLSATGDADGVECEFCHLLVNPDPAVNVAGTTEVQNPPFKAYDPATGEAYRGSGQYVLNGGGTRLGPYQDVNPPHAFLQSAFHRQGELCGTCHDVSNSAVGDLAWNNGAQDRPLAPGTFSGVPGAAVATKAAFNNPPYLYGVVERTSSEWTASALDTLRVADFSTLPAELQAIGGAIAIARQRALDQIGNANRPDYADGTPRYFTCQTCHMAASTGKGCNKNGVPTRFDLPRHDQTGGGYWMPSVVTYQDSKGQLLVGGGLNQLQRDALVAGAARAEALLGSAASLALSQQGGNLEVRVVNLTGHKLISGYPEGRRMWLGMRWYDAGDVLIAEQGTYGPIGRVVTDGDGVSHAVESLLDPAATVVYAASPGMDQAWASQLIALGYDPGLVLSYDRLTDAADHTLGDLAMAPAATRWHTFHFVLNNVMTADDRIPPYGFDHDEAERRNALPVPVSQYGDPGPGGVYDYFDARTFPIPAGGVRVEVGLYYQQTSWEYVQFLWLANDGLDAFLGAEGQNLRDAWLNTGMSPPFEMAAANLAVTAPASPGEPSKSGVLPAMTASWNGATERIDVQFVPGCDATDQAIYFGSLGAVGSYGYAGSACGLGTGGSVSIDPGVGDAFFVVVGQDGGWEGSYGRDGAGGERPEASGIGVCDVPQSLTATCD